MLLASSTFPLHQLSSVSTSYLFHLKQVNSSFQTNFLLRHNSFYLPNCFHSWWVFPHPCQNSFAYQAVSPKVEMTVNPSSQGQKFMASKVSNQTSISAPFSVSKLHSETHTKKHTFHLQQLMLNEKTVPTTTPYQDLRPSVAALLVYTIWSDQSTSYQQWGMYLLKKYFTALDLDVFLR